MNNKVALIGKIIVIVLVAVAFILVALNMLGVLPTVAK